MPSSRIHTISVEFDKSEIVGIKFIFKDKHQMVLHCASKKALEGYLGMLTKRYPDVIGKIGPDPYDPDGFLLDASWRPI